MILDTPASVENGGPIKAGAIPLNTGNAAFDPATSGGNHGEPHCPERDGRGPRGGHSRDLWPLQIGPFVADRARR